MIPKMRKQIRLLPKTDKIKAEINEDKGVTTQLKSEYGKRPLQMLYPKL